MNPTKIMTELMCSGRDMVMVFNENVQSDNDLQNTTKN